MLYKVLCICLSVEYLILILEETKNSVMNVDIAVLYLYVQLNMDQVSNLAMSQ